MNLAQLAGERHDWFRVQHALDLTRHYPDRGFEWHYWYRRSHLDDFTLLDPNGWIAAVAFSPDGSRLATGGPYHPAKIWEVNSRRVLHELVPPPDPSDPPQSHSPPSTVIRAYDGVWGIAWSSDSKWILTGGDGGAVRLWDADTGKLLRTYPKDQPKNRMASSAFQPPAITGSLSGHRNRVEAACLSPDGKRVLSGDNDGTVIIWDTESGEALHSLSFGGQVHAAAFSTDGRYLAIGDYSGNLELYDGNFVRRVLSFEGANGSFESLAFTPDGSKIVTVGQNNGSSIWEVKTGRMIRVFKRAASNDMSVAISPDGQLAVTGGPAKKARVWNLETGENLRDLDGHIAAIEAAAFSPNGRQFVTASEVGEIKFWNLSPKPFKMELAANVQGEQCLAFSPDGQKLAIGNSAGTIQIWEVRSGKKTGETAKQTQAWPGQSQVWSLAFFPSGRQLVAGGTDGSVKIWDAETFQLRRTFKGHRYFTGSVAVSSDGSRIVSAAYDGTAIVWNAESGKICYQWEQKGHAEGVAIAPDGQRFASACSEAPLKIFGWEDGKELLALPGAHGPIAFSPDGNLLAIYSRDRKHVYQVIDPANGRPIFSFSGPLANIRSLGFSPDGHRILSGGSTAQLWDSQTGRELLSIPNHVSGNAAFSPDGNTIAVASEKETILYMSARADEIIGNK